MDVRSIRMFGFSEGSGPMTQTMFGFCRITLD